MILDCILVFLFVKVFVAIASKRLKMFGVLDESLLLKTSPWLISSDYEDQQDVMVEKARSSFTLWFCNIICHSHRFNLIYKLISIQSIYSMFPASQAIPCQILHFISSTKSNIQIRFFLSIPKFQRCFVKVSCQTIASTCSPLGEVDYGAMILGGRQRVDSRDTRPPKTPSSSKATPTGSEWKSLNREIEWKINDVNGKEGFFFKKEHILVGKSFWRGKLGVFPGCIRYRNIKTSMVTIFDVMSIYCDDFMFFIFKMIYEL